MTDVALTYDNANRLTQTVDSVGTTSYTYDNANRLTQVSYPGSKSVSYTYDNGNRRTQVSVTDAGNTSYSYNAANYLTGVTNPNSESTSYTYNDVGLPTRVDLSNGTYATYSYDSNRYWLTSLANKKSDASTLSSFAYQCDYAGNPSKMTLANGDYVNYGYDNVYQLTSEVKKDSGNQTLFSASYTYDAGGNRTQSVINGNETNYTYDDFNKMTAAGSASFGYDNNGSLTSKTVGSDVTSYSYNEANQMTGTTYPDQSTNSFTYYSNGLRRSKTDSSGTRVYLHDGLNLLGEWDSGGNLQAYWTCGLGLISQRRASTSHWYHFDRMGNVKQLTNSGQTVTDTYDTDAWGANGSSSGSTVNPFRFGGQFAYFTDPDSGLLRLGVRYLDPTNGRFTQRDPVPRLQAYVYAMSSPASITDRSGRDCDVYHMSPELRWEALRPPEDHQGHGDWEPPPEWPPNRYYVLTVGKCECPKGYRESWTVTQDRYSAETMIYEGYRSGLTGYEEGFPIIISVGEVSESAEVRLPPEVWALDSDVTVRIWMQLRYHVHRMRCVKEDCVSPPARPSPSFPVPQRALPPFGAPLT